jgi:hypothetical protein
MSHHRWHLLDFFIIHESIEIVVILTEMWDSNATVPTILSILYGKLFSSSLPSGHSVNATNNSIKQLNKQSFCGIEAQH